MKRITSLLLFAFLIFAGGFFGKQKEDVHFPIKIGLLADTQLTSHNGFSNYSQRSKFADRMVDVAIRPPALESLLAEEMLGIALKKLTEDSGGEKDGVDVILYLGDGMNSGGTDEMEKFFSILEKHRDTTGIPIFVVIGNHDYLGCGNIVSPGTRFALLNRDDRPRNPALSKYQVLKKISEFNRANNDLPGNERFRYIDNCDSVEQNKELDHNKGLYLSGLLFYSEEGKNSVEVLLLDTSDYKDAPDWSSIIKWGFYGVIGSLSFNNEPGVLSQTGYLRNFSSSSSPDFRFLASHYPKDHLDRITLTKPGDVPLDITNVAWEVTEGAFSFATFMKTLNRNLEGLLSKNKRNYWVSGHTHAITTPRPSKIVVGGLLLLDEKYFHGLNTGSTTDYRAHAVIVESYERTKNNRIDKFVGYREIPLFDYRDEFPTSVLKAIGEYGKEHYSDPNFENVVKTMDEWNKEEESVDLIDSSFKTISQGPGNLLEKGFSAIGLKQKGGFGKEERYQIDIGATILGLNKRYRDGVWSDKQTEASGRHLREFVKLFVSRSGNKRDDVISCLGLLAGAYEIGKLPEGCDFNPSYLQQLCRMPK